MRIRFEMSMHNQLPEALNASGKRYSKELGNSRPGAKELLHLARVYEIEPEEFYVGAKP